MCVLLTNLTENSTRRSIVNTKFCANVVYIRDDISISTVQLDRSIQRQGFLAKYDLPEKFSNKIYLPNYVEQLN
jgi:hypothetical protein